MYFSALFRPQLLINHSLNNELQSNLSTTATLETEENVGRCGEVAVKGVQYVYCAKFVLTVSLDCLHSALSLKIRLVLISRAVTLQRKIIDCSQSTVSHNGNPIIF